MAHDGVQIDEDARPQHLVDFVFAGRVAAHEPLQRRRLIGREMIDVQVGIFLQALDDEIDERSNAAFSSARESAQSQCKPASPYRRLNA